MYVCMYAYMCVLRKSQMGGRHVEHVERGRLPAKTDATLHCCSITASTGGGERLIAAWQPTNNESLLCTPDF